MAALGSGVANKKKSLKSGWEERIAYESKADDVKAKEFSEQVGWSKKRAQDVPSFAEKPSAVKSVVEQRVKEESKDEDDKARSFLKETKVAEEVVHFFPEPSQIKEKIDKRAAQEKATSDEKARKFLDDTTMLGVERRKFKSGLIPLVELFSKPHKDQVLISPKKTYIAWRSRGRSLADLQEDDNGVMNIFVKKLDTNKIRQITFYKEHDACVHYLFTPDDKSIVFLRETERGSEQYHLYAMEIEPFFDQDDESVNDPNIAPPAKPRNLIKDPNMTCGIGFAGGTQLWMSSESSPRQVYVSTSQIGPFAMFWDISKVNIDTSKLTLVEQNRMSTSWGRFKVIFLTFIARILGYCCIKIKPPTIPIQWFPDNEFSFRGRLEIDLLDLGASFCARPMKSKTWKTIHACSFEESNLQLIGSSGGSGTARMEFDGDNIVDIHLCAFKSDNTTTYERFNIKSGQYLKRVAGGNAKSDITGFVTDPKTGKAQFVYYEYEKIEMEIIDAENSEQLDADIEYIKDFLEPSMTFQIVSRARSDETWVLYAESGVGHSLFQGSPSAYFLFSRRAIEGGSGDYSFVEYSRNIELVFPSRPEMKKYKMARMDPVHVKARDGEDILCYLSRVQPPSIRGRIEIPPGPPPPLVVAIHGGPQARDSFGFNPLCQFLCSRGFRVLQVCLFACCIYMSVHFVHQSNIFLFLLLIRSCTR